jgi:hypothetical protein
LNSIVHWRTTSCSMRFNGDAARHSRIRKKMQKDLYFVAMNKRG